MAINVNQFNSAVQGPGSGKIQQKNVANAGNAGNASATSLSGVNHALQGVLQEATAGLNGARKFGKNLTAILGGPSKPKGPKKMKKKGKPKKQQATSSPTKAKPSVQVNTSTQVGRTTSTHNSVSLGKAGSGTTFAYAQSISV